MKNAGLHANCFLGCLLVSFKKNKYQFAREQRECLPSVKIVRITLLLVMRYASAKYNFFSFMKMKIENKFALK